MTIAGFLARLRRAKRQDMPRVLIDLDVFTPDGQRAVVITAPVR